ncbi:MAG TPA: glycosyltransferase family 2 protein [Acidimicrobiales bacterium]|nr:glycosyltransferase family 2 protein [Acidimicrobiales bacterium]
MNVRELRRRQAFDELVDSAALSEFHGAHGDPVFAPVVVVAAAYHERDNIGRVVEALPETLCGEPVSFLVVVDGEEDGTAEIVRKSGRYAVVAPVNRGQGAALRLGYRVAAGHGARYIVTADADGQTDPADLAVVLRPVLDDEADLVTGSRRLGRSESAGLVRNFGIVFFSALITALTGTKVTDVANPIRAMRADLPATLTLAEPQYQSSELLIGALLGGARYAERPVTMLARASGHSKKGGNLVYGYRFTRVVLHTWWRERRGRA